MDSILNKLPSLDLITGPMYSGKTSELIRRLMIYHELGLQVLYINADIDIRGEVFSTHNPLLNSLRGKITSFKVQKLMDITHNLRFDVIGIDEAQFFPDLKEFILRSVEEEGKKVIVSGLNGDFMRRPFGQILDIIPFCDNITKLFPFCSLCNDEKILTTAHFTKRVSSETSTIVIGGKNKYIPVCRKCFLK